MKKVLIGCVAASCFAANAADGNIGVYGGFGLSATFTSSEYNMDFAVDAINAGDNMGGVVQNKFSGRKKLGYDIFMGISGGDSYYYALELGVNLNRIKMNKDLTGHEAKEMDVAAVIGGRYTLEDLHTNIKLDYGTEYNVAVKFGKRLSTKSFGDMAVYGILGLSTRDLNVNYDYYLDNFFGWEDLYSQYPHRFKKRLLAFTPGIGVEFKVHERCSLGLEYKYKFYKDAESSKDLRDAPTTMPAPMNRNDFDTRPRKYKVKSAQSDLSLRVIINI